jgi:hypothetical protein
MNRDALKISLGGLVLVASCAPGLAWVGQTAHDWSLVIPVAETRLGIVEWRTGHSTVFLGMFDFSLPFDAISTALITVALGMMVCGTLGLLISRRWRNTRAT